MIKHLSKRENLQFNTKHLARKSHFSFVYEMKSLKLILIQ